MIEDGNTICGRPRNSMGCVGGAADTNDEAIQLKMSRS